MRIYIIICIRKTPSKDFLKTRQKIILKKYVPKTNWCDSIGIYESFRGKSTFPETEMGSKERALSAQMVACATFSV